MNHDSRKAAHGPVVEEQVQLTLVELSRACGVAEEQVSALIVEGVIEPIGDDAGQWRFAGTALRRARVALRLSRDLELNPAGVALALDLIEEIDALRGRLRRLGRV